MKKIFLILSAAFLMVGCEDFLDTRILTEKTSENFPLTEEEADEVLTGIYAHLLFESPETSSMFYFAQLAGDECLGGNLSFSGNCATNFLMYKDNLNGLSGLWERCYTLINRANQALATMDKVTEWTKESRDRHFGEAHFLRAMAYYELAQMFGPIPLRTTTENTNIPRASVEEVYALIASDLRQAIELLPDEIYTYGSPMAGHATKYAAEALMARVWLFYTGRYAQETLPEVTKAEVVSWLEDCINNSGHDLVADQRNLWAYSNTYTNDNDQDLRYNYVVNNELEWAGNSSIETVFANKHNLKSNWTYTWWSNTHAQFCSPSADNYSKEQSYPFGTGWGAGPVSPAFVDDWKAWASQQEYLEGYDTDPRLVGSVWSYTAYDPNDPTKVLLDRKLDPNEPDYTVSYRYFEQTGYFQKKYININSYNAEKGGVYAFGLQAYPGISTQTSQQLIQIADLIHIRFADVLLMHSELTGDATGLNRVRERSGLAPVAYSLDAIKNERRYELAFESIRYWDLLRWSGPSLDEAGDALNKQTGFDLINAAEVVPMVKFDYKARLKETQGYWPIPQTEIDLSDGVLEQNPGWTSTAMFVDWGKM